MDGWRHGVSALRPLERFLELRDADVSMECSRFFSKKPRTRKMITHRVCPRTCSICIENKQFRTTRKKTVSQ